MPKQNPLSNRILNALRVPEKLKEDYDKESKFYDKVRFGSPGGKYVDNTEKGVVLKFLVGDHVLELGGGTGRYGIPIGKKGYVYTEIDISKEMLKIAKKKTINEKVYAHFLQSNAEMLPFSSNCFSCVICIHSIQYFLDPLKVLTEAYRVLKPRGRIIISSETDYFYRRFPFLSGWLQQRARQKYFPSKELKHLLREAGFKITFERSLFCLGSIAFYRKLPAAGLKLASKFDQKIRKGSILILVGEK